MMELIKFLDVHSDSLTFLVTAVYVIATIFICIFNGRSAKATREQVAESQRQFDETKRLERMPYFDVTVTEEFDPNNIFDSDILLPLTDQHPATCTLFPEWLVIKNIGAGTAANLSYTWQNTKNERQVGCFPFSTFEEKQTRELSVHFQATLFPNNEGNEEYEEYKGYEAITSLFLNFFDLLGNKYQQELRFEFSIQSADKILLKELKVFAPELIKTT